MIFTSPADYGSDLPGDALGQKGFDAQPWERYWEQFRSCIMHS